MTEWHAMTAPHAAYAQLDSELRSAQQSLMSAAAELGSPLSELVTSRIRTAAPYFCATAVLAAAYSRQDDNAAIEQRVVLATALEMLHVALGVHRLLVDSAAVNLDKSFIGSAILAGDYCFGRAARMAAQTGNPRIVTIFSRALQDVNEARLRILFGEQSPAPNAPSGDTLDILIRAGAAAGLEVSDIAGCCSHTVLGLAGLVADARRQSPPALIAFDPELLASLPAPHQGRWLAVQDLLNAASRVS